MKRSQASIRRSPVSGRSHPLHREATRSLIIRDQLHRDRHVGALCKRKDDGPFESTWRGLLSLRDPTATNLSVGARARGRATRSRLCADPQLTDAPVCVPATLFSVPCDVVMTLLSQKAGFAQHAISQWKHAYLIVASGVAVFFPISRESRKYVCGYYLSYTQVTSPSRDATIAALSL